MIHCKRGIALALSLVFLLAAGCRRTDPAPASTPTPTPSATPAPQPSAEGDTVRLGLMRGPGSLGMAHFLAQCQTAEGPIRCELTLGEDPAADLEAGLRSGTLDLAVLPVNRAVTLFHEDPDSVKLLALTAQGGWSLLARGGAVHGLADLRGKTVYTVAPGSDGAYMLGGLLAGEGLDLGQDVKLEPSTLKQVKDGMLAGEMELCLLPAPAAQEVLVLSSEVREVLDPTTLWEERNPDNGSLTGCLVARSAWLQEHAALVPELLKEMKASTEAAASQPEETVRLLGQYGLVEEPDAGRTAIPAARLLWADGSELLTVSDYCEGLFSADPASIGGSIPEDTFYYRP